ncbi:uncharacterized protein [Battus philenor]|uniref:uncharacterized protein n=1 Tax=Battus philenor TaxID=42288 RepID=UPI0035CEFFAE
MRRIVLVLCCVIGTFCYSDGTSENVRVKRAKYYSNPPQRFYRRPPTRYQNYESFSYTPSSNYGGNTANYRPYNRPFNGGVEPDIKNLIKSLSKNELNQIVEYAKNKDKYKRGQYNKYNGYTHINEDTNSNRFSLNVPYVKQSTVTTKYQNSYTGPEIIPSRVTEIKEIKPGQYSFNNQQNDETSNQQLSIIDGYIEQAMGDDANLYTDSDVMDDEQLPSPVNLRQEDFTGSYSDNVPALEAVPGSYDVESFGELPLMNYNSKLHSGNSYSVPHYTVTSLNTKKPSPVLSSPPSAAVDDGTPPLELAPAVTNYKDQSDAHLKAIKIWAHRSRGAAYTLHEDGTLSREKEFISTPSYK